MIIDTHVHIGNMLGFVLTENDVIYSMQTYGISHSIVSSLNAAKIALANIQQRIKKLERIQRLLKENNK